MVTQFSVVLILLLYISCANCRATNKVEQAEFLRCLTSHSIGSSISTPSYIHTPNSLLYSSLLQASQHNPRFLNSTTSKPLDIITPYDESEIQAAILCSKKHGLQVRIRSGGHDYEGLSYRCKSKTTRFIIIDLLHLRSISVDIDAETAWVQSGATLGELYYSIAKKSGGTHGFPGGVCPSVGIGGHFSGGGFGTMVRKYGIAADHVIDARLIDVYGSVLNREAMGEDLFWAIRGGGGASFGVIVSWKVKLVRVPPIVTVFSVDKRLDQGATKLVHQWQDLAHRLPKELFIRIVVQDVVSKRKKTIQATFNSLFLGETNELITLMTRKFPQLGLTSIDCIQMSWIESVLYFAGFPRGESPEILLTNKTDLYMSNFKAKSDFVTTPIPKTGLEGIWERFLKEDLVFMIMDPYGGRMSEISETQLPFPHREGNLFNIQYLVKWDVNERKVSRRHEYWMRKLYMYMSDYVSASPRAAYLNYRDLDLGMNNVEGNISYAEARVWGEKYFKGNFERLAQVKTKVDPDNFFRNEQSIPLFPVESSSNTSHVVK